VLERECRFWKAWREPRRRCGFPSC
jgi:hypothetical protein